MSMKNIGRYLRRFKTSLMSRARIMASGEPVELMMMSTSARCSNKCSKGTASPLNSAGKLFGALVGPVGDLDVADSGLNQVRGSEFRHFASADEHGLVLAMSPKIRLASSTAA